MGKEDAEPHKTLCAECAELWRSDKRKSPQRQTP